MGRRWGPVLAAGAGVAVVVALVVWMASPGLRYRATGRQRDFNALVSRQVPMGSTLAALEAVAGPAEVPPADDRAVLALRASMAGQPQWYPDGWREGDSWVCYRFPGESRWWFQVRDGRLVNYDPAVLAGQPQEQVAIAR